MPEALWKPAVVMALREDGGALITVADRPRHLEGLLTLIPSATWLAVPVPSGREPGAFARSITVRSALERFDLQHKPEGAGNGRDEGSAGDPPG